MKPCDLCGKGEANMKVSQLDKDGKVTEMSICAECARQRGLTEVQKLKANNAEIITELKSRPQAPPGPRPSSHADSAGPRTCCPRR